MIEELKRVSSIQQAFGAAEHRSSIWEHHPAAPGLNLNNPDYWHELFSSVLRRKCSLEWLMGSIRNREQTKSSTNQLWI